MTGSLITFFPITNSEWVALNILWKAVSSHLLLWSSGSEWHCTFYERQSHHSFMTNSLWVTLHICERQTHHIFPITNRLWVILHTLWKVVSLLWPTGSEDIAHFVKGSLITPLHMTNSMWVTLHILWMALSLDLSYVQQFVGDITHFCEMPSHYIFSYQRQVSDAESAVSSHFFYDQQGVSDIAYLWTAVSSHLSLWPTACEWHCILVNSSLITYFPMTNSLWVIFDLHSQHTPIDKWLIYYYIRKWACCHVFSMSFFYIVIIIDCRISFQHTHSHLMWPFLLLMTFFDFQVSDPGSWGSDCHINLHASV